MKLGQVNNVSFGAVYYEGVAKFQDDNKPFYFQTKHRLPEDLLTAKQVKASRLIKNALDETEVDFINYQGKKYDFKVSLVEALHEKKTDVHLNYPKPDTIELSLKKWKTGDYGDEYSYNPYNKKGTRRISAEVSLIKNPTPESINRRIKRFIADSVAYLTDNNNIKNRQIEDEYDKIC